jgi:hypothetical protein
MVCRECPVAKIHQRVWETEVGELGPFLWKDKKRDEEIRRDCTSFASSRLGEKLAKFLCIALHDEHPGDKWINEALKCHRIANVSAKGLDAKPIGELKLELWYKPGTVAESGFVGIDCPKIQNS